MDLLIAVLSFLPGYAIGSISSGYLVGRVYRNVDLREVGSGSTGATNTLRALGPGAALLVALLDILKGMFAVVFARLVFSQPGDLQAIAQASAAVGAIAGHCWPMLLGRGGRGVATGFGALMLISGPAWTVATLCFFVGVALTRRASVGSLASLVGAVVGYVVFSAVGAIDFDIASVLFILIGAAIIIFRHRANIRRIALGVEPQLGAAGAP